METSSSQAKIQKLKNTLRKLLIESSYAILEKSYSYTAASVRAGA